MKNLIYIGNQLSDKNKTPTSIETLGVFLRSTGFNVKTASSKKNKVHRLFDMLNIVFVNRKSTDYVLIDTYSTLNFYFAYMVSQLCRLCKLKYIPILRGGDLPKRLSQSPKMSKSIFGNAYKNVAPSEYTKSNFESLGYSNLICIPNSIELKDYPLKKRNIDEIRLLWVRSFSEIYNPTLAVDVLKVLKEEGFGAKLCMIGPDNDGTLGITKKYAQELGLNVEFTGKLSKPEWHKKSEAFNIFINTTNVDNTPVSVIEAMALGLPVISTNVGGVPFLIENDVNGILVEPNSVASFVKAIKQLKASPELSDEITEIARKTTEAFDWEIVKKQWFDLLS